MMEKNKQLDDLKPYLDEAVKFFDERDRKKQEIKEQNDRIIKHNELINEEKNKRQRTDDDPNCTKDPYLKQWEKRCVADVPHYLHTQYINDRIKNILGMFITYPLGIIIMLSFFRYSLYAFVCACVCD